MRPSVNRSQLCISAAHQGLHSLGRESAQPPIPVNQIAVLLGFQVVQLQSVDDACSAIVSIKERLIGINARHHRHRQRFSLGHEIAHILLKHPPESRCTAKEIELYNLEADMCAAEILMPEGLMKPRLDKAWSITQLAREFDVSEEAMKMKLGTL